MAGNICKSGFIASTLEKGGNWKAQEHQMHWSGVSKEWVAPSTMAWFTDWLLVVAVGLVGFVGLVGLVGPVVSSISWLFSVCAPQ